MLFPKTEGPLKTAIEALQEICDYDDEMIDMDHLQSFGVIGVSYFDCWAARISVFTADPLELPK